MGNHFFCLWRTGGLSLAIAVCLSSIASAQMKFYYDPTTGNVAFDTTGTRSGYSYSYGFDIYPPVTWEFRWENQIRISNSSLFIAWPDSVSDYSTVPFQGLYTVGNIMPVGLSEAEWKSFARNGRPRAYTFADVIGGGTPPPAELIYGAPEGEFVNRWDLIDPATLGWASAAKIVYRAWSGEVLLDTTGPTGGHISSFHLQSNGQFLPSGFTPFLTGPLNGATTGSIFGNADAIEPGRYSIGEVLPAGLTASAFEAKFTSAQFIGRAGFNGGSFDFETDGIAMTLQFVPEPHSLSLLAIGMLAGLLRVRR